MTTEQEIANVLSKLKPVPDAQKDAAIALRQAQERAGRIEALKASWNAPKRHLGQTRRIDGPYAEWWARILTIRDRLGSGFIIGIIGENGPGKTQLAVEAMRHQVEARFKSALYCTAVEFFMDIKSTYRKDADSTEADVLTRYCKPALLVIDEIGKRSDSAWENTLLFELIDRRYRDVSDTLILSNQKRDEFLAGIGPALASRMSEDGGIVDCKWGSFRG